MVEPLGGGGMSAVWRAYDEVLGRQVAVKVVAGPEGNAQTAREWITREARTAARLSHPHITAIHDYGESVAGSGERVPYVVMELVPGPTLAERLKVGPLPVRSALLIGAQVAAALAAAHARGLVHRDIKPGNVLLSPSGAKVVDFGIAAVAGDPSELPQGLVWGTPAYLAPERLGGGEVVPASDVYALGLLLYRLLAGQMPWQTETVTQMLKAHRYAEPAPMPPLPGVPDAVAEVCRQCLAKDPGNRPTAAAVAQVLGTASGWSVAFDAGTGDIAVGAPLAGAAAEDDPDAETRIVPRRAPGAALWVRSTSVPAQRAPRRRRAAAVLVPALGLLVILLLAGFWAAGSNHGGAHGGTRPGALGPASSGAGSGSATATGSSTNPGGAGSGPAVPGGGAAAAVAGGAAAGGAAAGGDTGGGAPAGGSAPGGPATHPAPNPQPAPTRGGTLPASPVPSAVTRTVSTVGGTVTATCVGSTATLTGYNPAPGFTATRINRGPGSSVGLTLHALVTDVTVGFTCRNGVPQPSIS